MATYKYEFDFANSVNRFDLEEFHMYGSSRIGTIELGVPLYENGTPNPNWTEPITNLRVGHKRYELTNHGSATLTTGLGNVMAVVNDRTQGIHADADGNIDYYEATVLKANDYYPFGSLMPGREYSAGDYRFSFNGQESDSEVKGEGNQQDYGARIYDPRLGRWLSVDPYSIKYPNLAPYISFENSPICIIDPGGDTTIYYSQSGKLLHISYDKLPTAITIVSNRNVVRFIRQLQYARSKNLESNKGVNNLWRSYGRSFDVASLRTFYDENTKPGINNRSGTSPTGFLAKGYFNESRAYLYQKDGVIFTGENSCTDDNIEQVTSFPKLEPKFGDPVGKVHTHPNEGLARTYGTIFNTGPSKHDIEYEGSIEVEVSQKNIYIHGLDVPYIAVDKNTLKKVKP